MTNGGLCVVVPDCHLSQDSAGRNCPQIKPKIFKLYIRKYFSSFKVCRTFEYSLSKRSMAVLSLDLRDFFCYQSWVFIGRTDVEAETPILWPPDAKS